MKIPQNSIQEAWPEVLNAINDLYSNYQTDLKYYNTIKDDPLISLRRKEAVHNRLKQNAFILTRLKLLNLANIELTLIDAIRSTAANNSSGILVFPLRFVIEENPIHATFYL